MPAASPPPDHPNQGPPTGTPGPAATPPEAAPRWMRVLLFASLALNLLFVGLAVGTAASHGWPGGRDAPPARSLGFGPYSGALERAERRALLRELRSGGWRLVEDRSRLRESYSEVLEALRAEPFESAALAAALERQARIGSERAARGQAALVAVLSSASPAERRAFADRLERRLAEERERRP